MPQRLPPGPSDWFFGLGQIRQMQADPLGYFQHLQRAYGDIVCTRIGPYRDYVFYHPDQVREFLVTKNKSFHKMTRIRNIIARLTGNGLITSEGDTWLRQRRLVQPAFHPNRFDHYAAIAVTCSQGFVEYCRNQHRATGVCEIEISRAMIDLTMEIIAQMLFDIDLSAETAEIAPALAYLSEVMMQEMSSLVILPDWLPLKKHRKKRWAIGMLDDMVWRCIRQRRAAGEDRGDLLSMLLLAVDEEAGGNMTDEQARDEAISLFSAGTDTTAAGLTWVCYVLARYPDVTDRIIQEGRTVHADRAPTANDLPRLRYLEMVIRETLRLFPPAIGVFTRQAIADVEIGGYLLRKGSLAHAFSFVTQRDPRWFPDPERFDPERFAQEREDQRPPFAYFPFGGGPRLCIAQPLAMMVMMLVAATLLQQLRPRLSPGQGEAEPQTHMGLRPRGGLRLQWAPHEDG